jgi:hypothetical protein
VRRWALLVSLAVALAACGESGPPPRAGVARAIREWMHLARVGPQDALCSRTFMAYDVPTRLWKRIGADFDAPGPRVAPPPAEVLSNCRGEFSFTTFFDRPLVRTTRVLRVSAIHIGPPVRGAGGITRTASAGVRVRDKDGVHEWGPVYLVRYRGRWRVLQHYD